MTEDTTSLAAVSQDWDTYQQLLLEAIAVLTDSSLLSMLSRICTLHVILYAYMIARAKWFHSVQSEGGDDRW